jgi:hypothetical protein
VLGSDTDATCRFYEGRLCRIHRELGPDALPVACQQFPRVVLRDGRGTFVTLSHFCPTAARLLLERSPLEAVEAPDPLTLNGGAEGLDATSVMPPLLRPGVLTDLAGYSAWERQCLNVLGSDRWTADDCVERIAAATDRLGRWDPSMQSLEEAVIGTFADVSPPGADIGWERDARRYLLTASAVPPGLSAAPLPPDFAEAWRGASAWWPAFDRATRSYIAAHLFGNWMSYHAAGLRTVVELLRLCLAVLRVEMARRHRHRFPVAAPDDYVEAVRHADLLLVHLVDTRSLARAIEHDEHDRSRTLPPLRRHRHPIG